MLKTEYQLAKSIYFNFFISYFSNLQKVVIGCACTPNMTFWVDFFLPKTFNLSLPNNCPIVNIRSWLLFCPNEETSDVNKDLQSTPQIDPAHFSLKKPAHLPHRDQGIRHARRSGLRGLLSGSKEKSRTADNKEKIWENGRCAVMESPLRSVRSHEWSVVSEI